MNGTHYVTVPGPKTEPPPLWWRRGRRLKPEEGTRSASRDGRNLLTIRRRPAVAPFSRNVSHSRVRCNSLIRPFSQSLIGHCQGIPSLLKPKSTGHLETTDVIGRVTRDRYPLVTRALYTVPTSLLT